MSFRSCEAAIDEIVARCDGDIRGALKALLLVNEHLEAEITQLYAAAARYGISERSNGGLVPAIRDFLACGAEDVDAGHKAGHDEFSRASLVVGGILDFRTDAYRRTRQLGIIL
jgi:hypothetical protein